MLNKKRAPIPPLDNSIPPKSNVDILADNYENQFMSAIHPKPHLKLGMDAANNTVAARLDEEIKITEKEVRDNFKHLRNKAPVPTTPPISQSKMFPRTPSSTTLPRP